MRENWSFCKGCIISILPAQGGQNGKFKRATWKFVMIFIFLILKMITCFYIYCYVSWYIDKLLSLLITAEVANIKALFAWPLPSSSPDCFFVVVVVYHLKLYQKCNDNNYSYCNHNKKYHRFITYVIRPVYHHHK